MPVQALGGVHSRQAEPLLPARVSGHQPFAPSEASTAGAAEAHDRTHVQHFACRSFDFARRPVRTIGGDHHPLGVCAAKPDVAIRTMQGRERMRRADFINPCCEIAAFAA